MLELRTVIKSVLSKSVNCLPQSASSSLQSISRCSPSRISLARHSSFQSCGLDFAGPLLIQSCSVGVMVRKFYVLLITCASTRAVHLEMVTNMIVYNFFMALRWLCARREYPSEIVSDNFKTFKSASQIITSEESQRFMTNQSISWTFIIERAPWWGDFYERLVTFMELALKKTLMKYEELVTKCLHFWLLDESVNLSTFPDWLQV